MMAIDRDRWANEATGQVCLDSQSRFVGERSGVRQALRSAYRKPPERLPDDWAELLARLR